MKSFQGRDEWRTDACKLAKKIPMTQQYASHIVRKIETATSYINSNTPLKITLEVHYPRRGKAILIFRKQSVGQAEGHSADGPGSDHGGDLQTLLELIPEQHRRKKSVRQLISKCLGEHDPKYIRNNIEYANHQVRDQRKYRAYLDKALKEDWGSGYAEDTEEEQRQTAQIHARLLDDQKRLEREQEQKKAFEEFKAASVRKITDSMTEEEYDGLVNDFVEIVVRGNAFLMRRYRKGGLDNMSVKVKFEEYAQNQLLSDDERDFEKFLLRESGVPVT